MKTFKINDYIEIVCEWKKTRMAFKHEATLLIDGIEREKTKICYQNRTWECYEFQSVIHSLLEKTKLLTPAEKELILKKLDGKDGYEGEGNKSAMAGLKFIGAIAKLGDIFGRDQKEKNDWKARMLIAGLENRGLIMPDDWESLSEEQKEARLSGAIKQLN